jgi:hypothetical protein
MPTYAQQRFTLRIDQSSQPIKWEPIRSLMETGKWATGCNQLRWPDGVLRFFGGEQNDRFRLGRAPRSCRCWFRMDKRIFEKEDLS